MLGCRHAMANGARARAAAACPRCSCIVRPTRHRHERHTPHELTAELHCTGTAAQRGMERQTAQQTHKRKHSTGLHGPPQQRRHNSTVHNSTVQNSIPVHNSTVHAAPASSRLP